MPERIVKILNTEQITPGKAVAAMCAKIKTRHTDRIQAFLYYGSSLRAINDPDQMLDFYVLVDSYRKTHRHPVRVFLNWLLPPAVYYLENGNPDGSVSTCKYSVLSLAVFEKMCTQKVFLSKVWGRFSQPCILLFPISEEVQTRIQMARAKAIRHLATQTAPLFETPVDPVSFWARAFHESYRTELRPENPEGRSREIVVRYADRYENLTKTLFGASDTQGRIPLSGITQSERFLCKIKWALRRFIGKPAAAIHVLNSAFTFDGGLDYILHKLKRHSGKTITVTDHQRRHPILWSPILGWKLYRVGAFK